MACYGSSILTRATIAESKADDAFYDLKRWGTVVEHFWRTIVSTIVCLSDGAPQLRDYPISTIVSFAFTISTIVYVVKDLGQGIDCSS